MSNKTQRRSENSTLEESSFNKSQQLAEPNEEANKAKSHSELLYGIEDIPPWYMCFVLGFQVNNWPSCFLTN